jgi:hypothetical protein
MDLPSVQDVPRVGVMEQECNPLLENGTLWWDYLVVGYC